MKPIYTGMYKIEIWMAREDDWKISLQITNPRNFLANTIYRQAE